MARVIDQEYDGNGILIGVTVEDDGKVCEMERVRHGQWLPVVCTSLTVSTPECSGYVCSECWRMTKDNNEPYCHCGAKME